LSVAAQETDEMGLADVEVGGELAGGAVGREPEVAERVFINGERRGLAK
jgi:hypothetical protein